MARHRMLGGPFLVTCQLWNINNKGRENTEDLYCDNLFHTVSVVATFGGAAFGGGRFQQYFF